ncbi:LOW QUALITY PROTEIN: probable ATP-dependent RNA helicase DDX20 [Macrobrachium rosenbergii]|uniref:LOW QUALITY PROTEIN: probable ATP-dependent RNA helicase DDX20 n=1 Tax=Macrobrachium rosenbergii TaxID=79674 RepID=UPI0034D4E4F8
MAQRKAHIIDDRERTVDIQTEENVDFRSMYLSEHVLNGLKASGFERPSPIQLAAIPLGRCGLDMVVQAKSGTGKTCVFAVVALEMISVSASTTQVLILTPTREIAVQVTQVISAIGCKIQGLRISTFIGGLHLSLDKAKLKCCHIAVGTPGRITQLIEMGLLRLDNVRLFVLDEADQLLTGQFADGIAQIASGLPLNKQVLALSATYTEDVAKVAEGLMRTPNHVRLGKESPALIGIGQFVKLLPYHHQPHRRQQIKLEELMNILCTVTFNQCLVFSNSQLRAESLCNQLRSAGWPAAFLTGGQAQQDRLVALDALCSYKCRVLVSTDLSARGLDSEHVNLVVNLDLPRDHATYLHRIGRAGRFGSRGNAVTLVTEGDEWQVIRAIATLANVRIALLRGDLTSDITSKEEENQEFVDFLSDDDFENYLNVAGTQENNFGKKGKYKNVKTTFQMVISSQVIVAQVKSMENLARGKNKQGKGNTKDNLNVKKSSRKSLQKEKKLESDKKAEEKEEAQRKSLASVVSILKRLNLEHTFLPVSFNEIMTDISSRYDSISADDNPLVNIPSLPDAVEMSEKDKNDLLSHWKCLEDSLQKVILDSNDSWKDFMFTVENGLHSRINGEKNPIEGIDRGETVDTKLQNGSGAASYSGSEKYSSSEENQYVSSKHPFKESLSSQKKSSVIKQGAQAERKAHKKTSRVNKNESVDENYPYYPGHDPWSYYGAYADEEIESYSSSDSQVDNNWGSVGDMKNVPDPIYANASFENYMRFNFSTYQKYLDNVEKFSAMMDYVQTMGKISARIARDYHFGS